MNLPADQLIALGNLSRKKAGQEVDWINISAARALTDLGLAERDAEGWSITAAGQAALASQGAGEGPRAVSDPAPPADVTQIGPR